MSGELENVKIEVNQIKASPTKDSKPLNRKSKNDRILQRNSSLQFKKNNSPEKKINGLQDVLARKDLRNQIEEYIDNEV